MTTNNKKIIFFHIDGCEWCEWLHKEVWVWLKAEDRYKSWSFVAADDDSSLYAELEEEVYFYPTIVLVVDDIVIDTIVGVASIDEYAYKLDSKMTKIPQMHNKKKRIE